MAASADIRERLATELRLDLIGPSHRDTALVNEILPDPPSRWYLTGFLVPVDMAPRRKAVDPQEEMDTAEPGGADDDETPDRGASNPRYLPSSMGLSLLVEPETQALHVTCRWGEYRREESEGSDGQKQVQWRREQREMTCELPLSSGPPIALTNTDGIEIARHIRPTQVRNETGARDVLAVSLFLVNRRTPSPDEHEDEAMAFQAEIEIDSTQSIVARADLSGLDADDLDARIADLQYREIVDWAVGHDVSIDAEGDGLTGACRHLRTSWLPLSFVPRLIPNDIGGIELGMEALAALPDAAAARKALESLPRLYRDWIDHQERQLSGLSQRRREMAMALLAEARHAAERIEDGIALLADARVRDAFRLMNQALAAAANRRRPGERPQWYPFQLAFILLNLRDLVTSTHDDREVVDLLFFPTGGGKTEAYLGLAAFVRVWR